MRDRSLVRLRVRPGTNYLSSGRTVLATDDNGILAPELDRGLFVHETRLLSRYRWLIDGEPPQPVSASNVSQRAWLGYFIATAKGGPVEKQRDPISAAAQEAVELRLSRYLGGGMHEDVDVTNFARWPIELKLSLELESDFADQSETGGDRQQHGEQSATWAPGDQVRELRTTYEAEHRYDHQGDVGGAKIRRGLTVRFLNFTSPPEHENDRILFRISLAPHERWH